MRVESQQTQRWQAGEALDPRDIGKAWRRATDITRALASRRYQRSLISIPFVESPVALTTNATPSEVRTFRFQSPVPFVLERAYMEGYGDSSAEVRFALTTSGSPVGVQPLLSSISAARSAGIIATGNFDDISSERLSLPAATEYAFSLQGAAFNMEALALNLHILTDRWGLLSEAQFLPTFERESDFRTATTQVVNQALLSAFNASLLGTIFIPAAPLLFHRWNVNNATLPDLRTIALPRWDNDRAGTTRAISLQVWGVFDAPVTATIDCEILDETATPIAVASASSSASVLATGAPASISIGLTGAPGTMVNLAQDYAIRFTSNTATNARRVYALLWVSR